MGSSLIRLVGKPAQAAATVRAKDARQNRVSWVFPGLKTFPDLKTMSMVPNLWAAILLFRRTRSERSR
jgi:hypothetical protein